MPERCSRPWPRPWANLMPHVQTGRLRALAVATTKRSSNAPNIPTIAEWMARVTARSMPLGSQTPKGESETVWQPNFVQSGGLRPQRVKKSNDHCTAGRDLVLFLAWRHRGMGPAQKQPLHVGVGQDVGGGLVQHQSA